MQQEEGYENEAKHMFRTYFRTGNNWFVLALLIVALLIGQLFCTAGDLFVTFWLVIKPISRLDYFFPNVLRTNSLGKQYRNLNIKNSSSAAPNIVINSEPNTLDENKYFYSFANTTTEGTRQTGQLIEERNLNIYIYTALILLTIITTMCRTFFFYKVTTNSSDKIHVNSFSGLLKTPMRFFDTNPSGRILNRFSKDIGAIDEILPRYLLDTVQVSCFNIYFMILQLFKISDWTCLIGDFNKRDLRELLFADNNCYPSFCYC